MWSSLVAIVRLTQFILLMEVYWAKDLSLLTWSSISNCLGMSPYSRIKYLNPDIGFWGPLFGLWTAWSFGTYCLLFWNESLLFGKPAFHGGKRDFALASTEASSSCASWTGPGNLADQLRKEMRDLQLHGFKRVRSLTVDCHIMKTSSC